MIKIGCDIVNRNRFAAACLDEQDPFMKLTFSQEERNESRDRDDPCGFLAGRFAAKEAVYKALSLDDSARRRLENAVGRRIDLRDLSVVDEDGRPVLKLADDVRAALGIAEASVSISHDGDLSMAVAALDAR